MQVDKAVATSVSRMKQNAAGRDRAMAMVRKVRDGQMQEVWPASFSSEYPHSIIGNYVDVFARDLAETLAPLPALKCSAGRQVTMIDQRRAEKKNRIGTNFWRISRLDQQMLWGADQYTTYGFLPFRLQIDFENQQPIIMVDDPTGCYYELNWRGESIRYARTWSQPAGELAALYDTDPAVAAALCFDANGKDVSDVSVEVVYFVDKTTTVLYVPERGGLVLDSYAHGLGFCPVHIAVRPGLHKDPRGQFDDAVYIQLARAVFAQLSLEAAHKAVQAPIAVPSDMTELSVGADAVIQTDHPENVRRVNLEMPATTFQMSAQLDQEMKVGSRYPEGRLGQSNASVITGRGIEALMGTFDTQIKAGQEIFRLALREITRMCFEVELKLWPHKVQTINGTLSGESFQVTYTPSSDFGDEFTVDVTYGFASGMSPSNAVVMLLQLRGDGVIDRDTFRRQLPFDLDTDAIQRKLDVEQAEDALKQGLFAGLQASGQLMLQGQVQAALDLYEATLDIIQGRRQGKPIADIMVSTFEKQQQAAQQAAAEQAQQQAQSQMASAGPQGQSGAPAGPGGQTIPGQQDSGLMDGVAPGQAGMAPGGMPSIQNLLAGVSGNGQASMSAGVRKRLPAA